MSVTALHLSLPPFAAEREGASPARGLLRHQQARLFRPVLQGELIFPVSCYHRLPPSLPGIGAVMPPHVITVWILQPEGKERGWECDGPLALPEVVPVVAFRGPIVQRNLLP